MLEEDPQAWIGANIYILKKEADSEFWLFSVRLPFSKSAEGANYISHGQSPWTVELLFFRGLAGSTSIGF